VNNVTDVLTTNLATAVLEQKTETVDLTNIVVPGGSATYEATVTGVAGSTTCQESAKFLCT